MAKKVILNKQLKSLFSQITSTFNETNSILRKEIEKDDYLDDYEIFNRRKK